MNATRVDSGAIATDGGELSIERVPAREAGGEPGQIAHDVRHVPTGITERYLAPAELDERELGDMYESVLRGAFINDHPELFA